MSEKTMTNPEIDELDTYCGKWKNFHIGKKYSFLGAPTYSTEIEASSANIKKFNNLKGKSCLLVHKTAVNATGIAYPDDYLCTIQMPVRD